MNSVKYNSIDNLFQYLTNLSKERTLMVIIAVKDTPGLSITKDLSNALQSIGLSTDLYKKHGHSFVAIVQDKTSIFEKISISDEDTACSICVNSHSINLYSGVYQKSNYSSILIDGNEYSMNLRGLNIVLFDPLEDQIIDSVNFDTHLQQYPCRRSPQNNVVVFDHFDRRLYSLQSEYQNLFNNLNKKITEISTKIDELSKLVDVKTEHIKLLEMLNYSYPDEDSFNLKKRIFKYLPKATGGLRLLQLASVTLLRHFIKICESNGLRYWANGGTAIGAIRHNGFIPWDDDIDVEMMREDIIKLQSIVKNSEDFEVTEAIRVYGGPHHNYSFCYKGKDYLLRIDIFINDWTKEVNQEVWEFHNKLRFELSRECLTIVSGITGRDPTIPLTGEYKNKVLNLLKEYHTCELYKYLCESTDATGIIWGIDNMSVSRLAIFSYSDIFPIKHYTFEDLQVCLPQNISLYLKRSFGDIYRLPNDMLTHYHNKISSDTISTYRALINKYGSSSCIHECNSISSSMRFE